MSQRWARCALLAASIAVTVASSTARIQGQQPSTQKPAPTALIAGRVIDAATERPIAGALVVTRVPDREVAALSNAAGQFVLDGLPEGRHSLYVSRFGYLTGRSGQSHLADAGSGVTLAAGARVTDVVIRMWKFAAITGRVVDEHGDPIVALPVSASQLGFETRADQSGESPEGQRAITDDRGVFRFGALVPGQYVIFVPSTQTAVPRALIEMASSDDPSKRQLARQALEASGSTWELPGTPRGGISDGDLVRMIGPARASSRAPLAIYPTTFYPSGATSAGAEIVSAGAGEERSGIDLVMRPVIGVRVSGRLSGTNGPVAMQPLRLVLEAAADFAPALDPPIAATATDASGAFTFVGVPPGQYGILSLSMPEENDAPSGEFAAGVASGGQTEVVMVVQAMAPPRAVDSKAKPVHWALLPVTVGDRDVGGLEATYRRGFRFKGRVVFEGSGKLPDAKESWLALSIERADGRAIGLNHWASQGADDLAVSARGEFETGTVPPGRYLIRVPKPPPEWQLKSALVAGRDGLDDPLDVDADVDDVVLTFTAPTHVSGRVVDSAAVSHAGIVIFPTDSARWRNIGRRWYGHHRIRRVYIERDGRFSVSGLSEGEYYIVALRDPGRIDRHNPRQLQALAAIADRIVVTQASSREMTLRIRELR